MNRHQLISYLKRLDVAIKHHNTLYVYGSAACILLDEPDRTSLDIDVAGPYSQADFGDIEQAAEKAGIPINPEETYSGDHIEWIASLRLCLPKPEPETEIVLWQGSKLTVKTVPVPELIASRLIRYDPIDRSDIQYLYSQTTVTFNEIESAVRRLPAPFDRDPLVLDNLKNLKVDMEMWGT